jgi:hypothetical protein
MSATVVGVIVVIAIVGLMVLLFAGKGGGS